MPERTINLKGLTDLTEFMKEYKEKEFLNSIYSWGLLGAFIAGPTYYACNEIFGLSKEVSFLISAIGTVSILVALKYISKSKESDFYKNQLKELEDGKKKK